MKVLFVTNEMPPQGCGVAMWGQLQVEALERAGIEVTPWVSWPPVYLPDNATEFDVIYLNFHALTIGHILPEHLPQGPLICGYMHEYSTTWQEQGFPPIWDAVQLKLTEEEVPGEDVIPWMLPVPDYVPTCGPYHWDDDYGVPYGVWVGHTGLRGDGLDRIIPACEKNGWNLTTSKTAGRWLTIEEEIDRLAWCHVIVCQNHGGYAGQASAVSTAMAARRPMIVNSGRMNNFAHKVNEEEFNGTQFYREEDVETGVKRVLRDIENGCEKRPFEMAEKYSWKAQTERLIKIWKERL